MAKALKYPIRRHTRLSDIQDKRLRRRAKKLGVPVAVAMRLCIEESLDLGEAMDGSRVGL